MASRQEPPAGESPSGNDSDGEFDPSAEMLVNDFDDEQTLEEEEEENANESENADELDDLQREGDMPLEELLAMYGYEANPATGVRAETAGTGGSDSIKSDTGATEPPGTSTDNHDVSHTASSSHRTSYDGASTSNLSTQGHWIHAASLDDDDVDDDEDDEDYDEEADMVVELPDWRRQINVGDEYQAEVPDGLCEYDDVPAYENEDRIVWQPSRLPDKDVEQYLQAVRELEKRQQQQQAINNSTSTPQEQSSSPPFETLVTTSDWVPDNEQALLLLHQCGHKPEEAVRRKRMMSPKQGSTIFDNWTQWSEQECLNFEDGFEKYYKDFHRIQKELLPTRSVSEIVHFYYKWKKTERHDELQHQHRLERKKFTLNPNSIDFMDRFAEEMEYQASNLPSPYTTPSKPGGNHSMIPASYGMRSSSTSCPSSSSAVVASDVTSTPSSSSSSSSGTTASSVVNGVLSKEESVPSLPPVSQDVGHGLKAQSSVSSGISQDHRSTGSNSHDNNNTSNNNSNLSTTTTTSTGAVTANTDSNNCSNTNNNIVDCK